MKTKFLFVLIMLATMGWNTTYARHGEYGIKAGISLGAPLGPRVMGSKGAPGISPSVFLYYEYRITPAWGAMAEFNYNGINASFETPYADFYGDGTLIRKDPKTGEMIEEPITDFYIYYAYVKNGRIKNTYISLPLSAVYHTRKDWRINFGIHAGMRITSRMTGLATDVYLGELGQGGVVEAYDFVESDEFSKFQAGLNAGVQYQSKMGLNVDFRMSNDLTSFFKTTFDASPGVYRLMTLQATVGYRIGGGNRVE